MALIWGASYLFTVAIRDFARIAGESTP